MFSLSKAERKGLYVYIRMISRSRRQIWPSGFKLGSDSESESADASESGHRAGCVDLVRTFLAHTWSSIRTWIMGWMRRQNHPARIGMRRQAVMETAAQASKAVRLTRPCGDSKHCGWKIIRYGCCNSNFGSNHPTQMVWTVTPVYSGCSSPHTCRPYDWKITRLWAALLVCPAGPGTSVFQGFPCPAPDWGCSRRGYWCC